MTSELLLSSLKLIMPELILALGAMVLLMIGAFAGRKSGQTIVGLAVFLLIAAFGALFWAGEGTAFGGSLVFNDFTLFMQALALIGAALSMILSVGHEEPEYLDRFEFPVLMLLSTTGMLLMTSANDMLAFYMGLELMSLPLYVIAAINRDSLRSTEAGLKYFVLGSLSSGMLLYGISLVYGFTGNIGFGPVAAAISAGETGLGFIFGMVFVLAGITFKISAVPFHMWTPDVYEGAPTPVTAFFASAPKVAAMAIIVRLLTEAFGPAADEWRQVVVFIAIASMVLGAFAAIGQRNIKRLMAYSSITHMGYALVGLAADSEAGVKGVALYMAIYLFTTLGVFAIIMAMRLKEGGNVENIDDLAGLSTTKPVMAVVLTALMFSLAGVPPLAGFFGKYFVFLAAIDAKLYTLAIIGIVSSVVACFYYLRVIKVMWFDEPTVEFSRVAGELRFVFGISGLFAIGYLLFGGALNDAAEAAAAALF
ncbi:MAG: NADH-quinone oxidoreductase subunit NuoN [Martelella sp.]|uniref:NADH-quinone oxidoreductase subunit N n=1 Tax=Martelella mediterranea DSM 17316 TaxID=1122214 RepID=A0A1U9Z4M4_9HYPH|nr:MULTISPECIES: NADH-quinone oxidoreductase subunit NuoN [Martelella]AQZ52631.1 NADH-quinone oxidoreductase subunit N [Martelella mediterranea DSM 17316]MAU19556.1 NADH-quinone oxidoreductase subunit NuoN [Martelella sp.]